MAPRFFWLIPLLALFGGCSAYHPLKDGSGFTDAAVGTDSVLVTYTSTTSADEARRFALLRTAELAALRGMPYFQITGEHIYQTQTSSYSAPMQSSYVTGMQNRNGQSSPIVARDSSPAYTQSYTITEAQVQSKLLAAPAEGAVPAAYLLREAKSQNITLSSGVDAKLAALPAPTGPVTLPPAPPASSRPALPPMTPPR